MQLASVQQQYSHEPQWYQYTISPNPSPVQSLPDPPHVEFFDPWDAYYETNADQTESASHECFVEAQTNVYEHSEPLPIPHNHCDDHQSSHITNANVDTMNAPHISIRSSFIDESNDIVSNANIHPTCNQLGDTSSHSINENSFLTVTHDTNAHASTLVPSSNNGSEMLDNGEHNSESCHNGSYDGKVEDETTDRCEEVGKGLYFGKKKKQFGEIRKKSYVRTL